MEPRRPTPLDDFLFDLRGYLVPQNAVGPELVDDWIASRRSAARSFSPFHRSVPA
jgi:hypothetical protein